MKGKGASATLLTGFLLGLILAYFTPELGLKAKNERIAVLESELAAKEAEVESIRGEVSKLQMKLEVAEGRLKTLESSLNVTVILLPNRDYLQLVKRIISAANRSVYVAMYVVKYDRFERDDPVNQLLEALVDDRLAGLNVKVLVDDQTKRSYADTLGYLVNHSIPVKLDKSRGITTHVKLVVVDGKYLFIGSHNWTESALTRNNEYSILIVSEYYAQKAEEYFETLWSEGREV